MTIISGLCSREKPAPPPIAHPPTLAPFRPYQDCRRFTPPRQVAVEKSVTKRSSRWHLVRRRSLLLLLRYVRPHFAPALGTDWVTSCACALGGAVRCAEHVLADHQSQPKLRLTRRLTHRQSHDSGASLVGTKVTIKANSGRGSTTKTTT